MGVMIILAGILGLVIIVAVVAAIATVVSTAAFIGGGRGDDEQD